MTGLVAYVMEPASPRDQISSRDGAALREHRPKASVRLKTPDTRTHGESMPNTRTQA